MCVSLILGIVESDDLINSLQYVLYSSEGQSQDLIRYKVILLLTRNLDLIIIIDSNT